MEKQYTFEIYRKMVDSGRFLIQTKTVKVLEMEFRDQMEANEYCKKYIDKNSYAIPKW